MAVRPQGRPARVNPKLILDAALELFLAKGFQGTTLRDLAQELRVTTAALYYHFPSKGAVLDALITPYLDDLAKVSATGRGESPRHRRTALIQAYAECLMSNVAVARFVDRDITALTDPSHGARLTTLQNRLRRSLADPERGREALLVAAAAIGAVRRPLLELGVRNQRELTLVLSAAGHVLHALP